MKLTDSGESRIRGYLYVLERSLRSFLSPEVAAMPCEKSNRTFGIR